MKFLLGAITGFAAAMAVAQLNGLNARPYKRDPLRPDTDGGQLRVAADALDLADKAFGHLARLTNKPNPVTGDGMQRDLRRIAQRLDALDNPKETA